MSSSLCSPQDTTPSLSLSTTRRHFGQTPVVKKYDLCPDGDVQIILTYNAISINGSRSNEVPARAEFLVSSTVLIASSPVFQAMLGSSSKFLEAEGLRDNRKSGNPYPLMLGDDHPVAMQILLNILHLRNSDVPALLDNLAQLKQMAILCDKYQCANSISMWTEKWLPPYLPLATEPDHYVDWLFISWAFECEDVFRRVSRNLIMQSVYAAGRLIVPSTRYNEEDWMYISQAVSNAILGARKQAFVDLLDMLKKSTYIKYESAIMKTSICKPPSACGDDDCPYMLFASFHAAYKKLGILDFSFASPNIATKTVEDFVLQVKALEIRVLPDKKDDSSWDKKHAKCNPQGSVRLQIAAIIAEVKGLELADFKSKAKVPVEDQNWEMLSVRMQVVNVQ